MRGHRLQLFDDTGFDEHARLLVRDRHIEHASENLAFQVGQVACAICLFRLHACTARRCAAALRVAFDQRDKAIVGQLLMFRAQALACRRVALHARAQALVQQDGAGVEASAADQANVLFEGNVRFVVHDDLRLHGRNCPEPSPARRSAAVRGQGRPRAASVLARAALDGENDVIR